jgi:hypothetical protein
MGFIFKSGNVRKSDGLSAVSGACPPLLAALLVFAATPAHPLSIPSDCDYLVLTDSLLLPEAKRLADMRAATPRDAIAKPCVATMADIYRDQPFAGARSGSIIAFLRHVKQSNGGLPGHLVLFGDASIDADSPDNRVPSFMYPLRDPTLGTWENPVYDTLPSDDVYAGLRDTVPSDSFLPLMAVGRIPAGTLAQAKAYVDKVAEYETHFPFGPRAFSYGFAIDDDLHRGAPNDQEPIAMLPELHEELWNRLTVKPFVRRMLSIEFPIQPDFTKPAARDSLIGMFNQGISRFYFLGHGSPMQLTDENILNIPGDLARLKPRAGQPIAAMLGCTTAPYSARGGASMGEQMLFHPLGVIAFLGAVAPTYSGPNNELFAAWDDTASRGGTLGRAFVHAKVATGSNLWNSLAFALLGDPALSLHVPAFDLAPALGSGRSRLVLQGAGAAGDSIYFQYVRVDSIPFAPFLHPLNEFQRDRKFLRETVVVEGRAALGLGGDVSLDLPANISAVKVMTWNGQGMRYGHFPLASLGILGVRGQRIAAHAPAPYRLILSGNRIRIQWAGAGPGKERQADINGAARWESGAR